MGYPNRDNRDDRRGGGGNYGRRDSGGGNYNNRPPMELHHAVCATCGKDCEVPFRPTGDRPVYCRDCFAKQGGRSENGGRGNYERNDNSPKPSYNNNNDHRDNSPAPRPQNNQQMDMISAKLDQIINLLSQNQAKPEKVKEEVVIVEAPSIAKASKDMPLEVAKAPAKKKAAKKKVEEVETVSTSEESSE